MHCFFAVLVFRLDAIPRFLIQSLGPLSVVDHEEVFVGFTALIEPGAVPKVLRAEHVHHYFVVDTEVAVFAHILVIEHVDSLDVTQVVIHIVEAHELELVHKLMTVAHLVLHGDLGADLGYTRLKRGVAITESRQMQL